MQQGRSFVCDVNGWSFVKNSRKYHEDCALLLMEFFEAAVKPSRKVMLCIDAIHYVILYRLTSFLLCLISLDHRSVHSVMHHIGRLFHSMVYVYISV
jgi:hypothetical protein